MFEPLNCIALRTIKHSDRHSILIAYTRQHGRIALALPAGNSRNAVRLRALSMPLGRFDCIADIRPGRDIYSIRDARPVSPSPSLAPAKGAISLFMADVLSALLREPEQDTNLYDFITHSTEALNSASEKQCPNIHLCFLLRLQHFLGIEPDWSTYSDGAVFDLNDGIFRSTPPLHGRFLPTTEAAEASRLRRMNFRNARYFIMSRFQRNTVLERLLQYYQIHFPGIGKMHSLTVLRTLFDF